MLSLPYIGFGPSWSQLWLTNRLLSMQAAVKSSARAFEAPARDGSGLSLLHDSTILQERVMSAENAPGPVKSRKLPCGLSWILVLTYTWGRRRVLDGRGCVYLPTPLSLQGGSVETY